MEWHILNNNIYIYFRANNVYNCREKHQISRPTFFPYRTWRKDKHSYTVSLVSVTNLYTFIQMEYCSYSGNEKHFQMKEASQINCNCKQKSVRLSGDPFHGNVNFSTICRCSAPHSVYCVTTFTRLPCNHWAEVDDSSSW